MAAAAALSARAGLRMFRVAWTISVMLITGACGREERTQTAFTPALERTSVTGDSMSLLAPAVAVLPDTTAADTSSAAATTLRLESLGEQRLTGDVTLARAGTATRVVASLSGGTAGQTYGGMIRRGTCAAIGSRVAALVPATADSAGAATSVSDATAPLQSLRTAPHIVVFGKNNRPQACGAI